jgi:hypothetical protein
MAKSAAQQQQQQQQDQSQSRSNAPHEKSSNPGNMAKGASQQPPQSERPSQSSESTSSQGAQKSQSQSDSQTQEPGSTPGQGKTGSEASGSHGSGKQGSGSKGQSPTGEKGGQPSAGSSEKGGEQATSSSTDASKSGHPGSSSSAGSSGQKNASGEKGPSGSPHSESGDKEGGGHPGGAGNDPGRQPGGGGQSNVGGGTATGPSPDAPQQAKDDSKASPRATEPENQGGDSVAPEGQPQSDLFLRKLDEALKNDANAKELEKETGYTREQLDQFITKYKQLKSAPAGPGRDINVKPGEQTAAQPSPNLPGLDSSTKFSTKNLRNRGSAPQDQIRDNLEGVRFQPPPEWRGKWEGYKNKLAKVAAPKRAASPSTKTNQ